MGKDLTCVVAGFGGQGSLFAGKVIATAGLIEDREVSWMPSYGPEMRGGTANCSVTLSDKPIGSPLITRPSALIALNQPSFDKFIDNVEEGGIVVVDTAMVPSLTEPEGVTVIGIPATKMCEEAGLKGLGNIVLIGMPGSGKSYLGGLIAKAFGRELINMDTYIEDVQGKSIPDIFAQQGEAAFRDMEVEASRVLGRKNGLVISAGGGTVVRKESMDALRQNGCVFFVDRPLSELATEGRPLSQGGESALQKLYDARIGLYTGYADVSILNTTGMSVEHIAETVLREYEKVCRLASLPLWEQKQI